MANRSKNIFAYLDSDDEDVPKTAPKKTEAAPPGAPVALNKGPNAGNKKAPKKSAVVEGEKKETRAPREGAPREGGRGAARGGRGGARGGRGGARDFERRSGTGRGKETSKQGGGARNWGNDADKSELVAEAEVQEGKGVAEDGEAAAEEAPVEEEEEEVQLTLDEYLAKKKESRVGELFAEKEVRQVTDDFSSAVMLTKDGKTPDFMESQFEKVFTKKTSGRKKQLITDLGFQAAAPERAPREGGRGGRGGDRDGGRDGGRGGRGGERGGRGGDRGRGAPRGGRAAPRGRGAAAPNVADMSAFPTL